MSVARIVLADDHPVVVDGLRRFFATIDGVELGGHCHDVTTLMGMDLDDVDVVILDVGIPGMLGGETIRALHGRSVRVLLFTMEPDSPRAIELVRAGADGIVGKSEPVERLAEAVARVARGETDLPEELAARSVGAPPTWPHESLSERELAIFHRSIRGTAPKVIAFDLGITVSSVYTYSERVRAKLGVSNQTELVAYAHRAGLLGQGA